MLYIYIYIYIYIYVCVCVCVCIAQKMYMYIHIYIYNCTRVYVCVDLYVQEHICFQLIAHLLVTHAYYYFSEAFRLIITAMVRETAEKSTERSFLKCTSFL